MRLIKRKAFASLFLFFVSFGVFAFSLKNDFVWDDVQVIEKSYYSFKASRIKSIVIPKIKKSKNVAPYYRPVVFISIVLDRSLWGITPLGFHLSNVVVNSVSTVVFYFLVLFVLGEFGVTQRETKAFLSSLLFALHPMHVESVSWVVGRTDLLCGLFFFIAFIFHTFSFRKLWFVILAASSFFLSLLSKEVAIVFPIVALGFDLLSRKYVNRNFILKYFVYTLLVLLYFYLRGRAFDSVPDLISQSSTNSTYEGYQILDHLKILLNSYLFYIYKLVFPFEFNAFIGNVPKDIYFLTSSILVIFLLCVISVISIIKKEYVTPFGIFWVFVTLGPSCLVAISVFSSTPLAERYLYIPTAGYCLLIGHFIFEVGKRINFQKAAWAFGLLLSFSYLFFTIDRQKVWKDDLILWEDTSTKTTNYAIPHSNYGMALKDAGKQDEAIRELLTALDPEVKDTNRGRATTANNLGLVYLDNEDYKNAEEWFLKARYYDSTYGRTYYHLGLIYFIKGEYGNSVSDYRMAEKYLKKTLEMYRSYGRANLLLAKVYIRLGEKEKARENAERAIRSGLIEPLSIEAQGILNELQDK